MQYLPEFLTVATIHLLAVMSPGPDFVMITRNSLKYSRRSGIYSALGLGLGILVHVSYSLLGISFVISRSIVLFSLIKFLGAGYLLYIGYKSLKARPHQENSLDLGLEKRDLGKWAALKMGFLTNILNPKVSLFFFALFTQVINPSTPHSIQVLYGVEMSGMTFAWFAVVATMFSSQIIKKRFLKVSHYVERAMGVILIGLGLKLAFTSSK